MPTFLERVIDLLPVDSISSVAQINILPIVILTILFALAITRLASKQRQPLIRFFESVAKKTFGIVSWVLLFLPVGVFSISFSLTAQTGFAVAGVGAYFIVLVSTMVFVFTLILYSIAVTVGRISLRRFAQSLVPSQAVAVGTRSSLACLPTLLKGAEKKLELPHQITHLVIPLAVSIFKITRMISSPVKLLFLAHVYGIHIEPATIGTFFLAMMLASFGTPGLPSGGKIITLPIEGLILLNTVDAIPDAFKTVLNITEDMTVATIVSRISKSSCSKTISSVERPTQQ